MMKKDDKKFVNIYRRVLKYPPFAAGKKSGAMLITHNTKEGKIIATAHEWITTEDGEKLYNIMYIAQKNKQVKIINIDDNKLKNIIRIDVNIKDIKKLTNNHNESKILDSIRRLKTLVITYQEISKNKIITEKAINIIIQYDFDAKSGILTLYINREFYLACENKNLTINLSIYNKLTATSKNLYSFIATNTGTIFTENLLIERAVIFNKRQCDNQTAIKKALSELKNEHIIKNFIISKKDGKRLINIDKFDKKEINHNARKKLTTTLVKTGTKNPSNTGRSKD
jgi:hypothetical protein